MIKCNICDDDGIEDYAIADHFMNVHPTDTANKLFGMYANACENMVISVMSDDYGEVEEEDD